MQNGVNYSMNNANEWKQSQKRNQLQNHNHKIIQTDPLQIF